MPAVTPGAAIAASSCDFPGYVPHSLLAAAVTLRQSVTDRLAVMDYTAAIDDKAAERLAAFHRGLLAGAMKPLEVEGWLDGAEFVRALATGFAHDGERVMEIQRRYYGEQLELWKKYASFDHSPGAIEEPPKDRRFAGPEWRSHPYYALLVQSYLLSARCLMEIVHGARLEAPLKRKLEFFTRQLIDAMSPANFPWS